MALDATKVRVALTGSIITVPIGTPDPTSFEELEAFPKTVAGARNLGYTTEDGIEFSFSTETENIMGWQTKYPLRRLVTETPSSSSFTLRQLERDTWLTTMGGKVKKLSSDLYVWEPDEAAIPEYKIFHTFRDGDIRYAFGFRRAQQSGETSFSLVRTDAVNLPNEWTVMDSGEEGVPAWFVMTNDPTFEGTDGVVTPSTTATAGTPGTFNGATPSNIAALATVTASPATAWTTGQSVTLGDGSSAYWDGTAWKAGTAA